MMHTVNNFNPYLLPQFRPTGQPCYAQPNPLRWSPDRVQNLVQSDYMQSTSPSSFHAPHASSPIPANPVHFQRPQSPVVTASGDEYFMGADVAQELEAYREPSIPQNSTSAIPTRPQEHPLLTEARTLAQNPESANTDPSRPRTFRSRVAEGFHQWAYGKELEFQGIGQTFVGTGKTLINTPLTLVEGLGRGAIALTGGEVNYPGKSPANRLGEGVAQIGQGMGTIVKGNSESLKGMGKMVIFAPLAGVEVTARGVGVVAGATVAAGHAVAQGIGWVGTQVKNSPIGYEFSEGFHTIVPRNR